MALRRLSPRTHRHFRPPRSWAAETKGAGRDLLGALGPSLVSSSSYPHGARHLEESVAGETREGSS